MPKQVHVAGGNELLSAPALLAKVGVGYGQRVADLGCGGSGIFVLQAARLVGDRGRSYAVDILKTALQSVEVKAKIEGIVNVRTVWSNLELYAATTIKDGSLDVGLLINTLFQSDQPGAILKESWRMVKPGGHLLIVDWKSAGAPFGPQRADRIDPERMKRMVGELAGARVVEEFEAGPYHYGMIVVKS